MTALDTSNTACTTLVLIPLPLDAIDKLKRIEKEGNYKKHAYTTPAQVQENPIPTAVSMLRLIFKHNKIADDETPMLQACMKHAVLLSDNKEDLLDTEHQVYFCFTEITIVLMDLEQAIFRADLFSSHQQQQGLKELLYSSCQTASLSSTPSKQEEWVQHSTSKKSSNNNNKTSTAAKHSTATPSILRLPSNKTNNKNKKNRCMNGAECRNILNGKCPHYHSPSEITKAGAIVEEVICVSPNKVGWIIGNNGELIQEMRKSSGADIYLEKTCVSTKNSGQVRLLHVLGNRQVVEKGIRLVMETAARCKSTKIVKEEHVQALVALTHETQLDKARLDEFKRQSGGADFHVDSVNHSLRLVGTKKTVEKGIDVVLKSLDQGHNNAQEGKQQPSITSMPESVSAAATPATTNSAVAAPVAATSKVPSDAKPSWSSLATTPSPMTTAQRLAKKPNPTQPKVSKSTTMTKKKKKNTDVCIHGASCRYIRNGIDNCEFYHSAKELELAKAKAPKAAEADHYLYVPRAAMGHIIGRNGSTVNEIIQASGADIENDPVKKGDGTMRVVHISGKPQAVVAALEMILKRIPKNFKVERGPGKSSSTVSAVVNPKVVASTPSSSEQQTTNRLSPVQAAPDHSPSIPNVTDGVSLASSSGRIALVSEVGQSGNASLLTAVDDHTVITGETIPTQSGNGYTSPFQPEKRVPVSPSATDVTSSSLFPSVSSHSLVSDPSSFSIGTSPTGVVTSTSGNGGSLLEFLAEQSACIKGSPQEFCEWLSSSEDIVTLVDLAEACADDDYFSEVLQPGNGTSGVKGFKRNAFKTAILGAAAASESIGAFEDEADTNVKAFQNEQEPLAELMCPISHVLMVEDPVIAADGHTYERVAIEAWFHKQYCEVMTAKQQMTTVGGDSQQARAIIERGVLSPITHQTMPHLQLTSNHALRTMAKDAAALSTN